MLWTEKREKYLHGKICFVICVVCLFLSFSLYNYSIEVLFCACFVWLFQYPESESSDCLLSEILSLLIYWFSITGSFCQWYTFYSLTLLSFSWLLSLSSTPPQSPLFVISLSIDDLLLIFSIMIMTRSFIKWVIVCYLFQYISSLPQPIHYFHEHTKQTRAYFPSFLNKRKIGLKAVTYINIAAAPQPAAVATVAASVAVHLSLFNIGLFVWFFFQKSQSSLNITKAKYIRLNLHWASCLI